MSLVQLIAFAAAALYVMVLAGIFVRWRVRRRRRRRRQSSEGIPKTRPDRGSACLDPRTLAGEKFRCGNARPAAPCYRPNGAAGARARRATGRDKVALRADWILVSFHRQRHPDCGRAPAADRPGSPKPSMPIAPQPGAPDKCGRRSAPRPGCRRLRAGTARVVLPAHRVAGAPDRCRRDSGRDVGRAVTTSLRCLARRAAGQGGSS